TEDDQSSRKRRRTTAGNYNERAVSGLPNTLSNMKLDPPESSAKSHTVTPTATLPSGRRAWSSVNANRRDDRDFSNMKKPTADDPPESLARWLQFNKSAVIKGVTVSEAGTVDLRDVRGYHQVMTRLPLEKRGNRANHYARCVTSVLRVLTVPGRYADGLQKTAATIAGRPSLTPCAFTGARLSDSDVVVLLAAKGLTAAAADDAWQFCYKFVNAQAQQPDPPVSQSDMHDILRDASEVIKTRGQPLGIRPAHEDEFPKIDIPKRSKKRGDRLRQAFSQFSFEVRLYQMILVWSIVDKYPRRHGLRMAMHGLLRLHAMQAHPPRLKTGSGALSRDRKMGSSLILVLPAACRVLTYLDFHLRSSNDQRAPVLCPGKYLNRIIHDVFEEEEEEIVLLQRSL
ncbi:hypothetical protein B0H11DRAFT_1935133, partial [Mycena galericulata]